MDKCAEVASLDTGRVLGLVDEVQREGAHRVSVEAMALVLQLDTLALEGEDALWSAVALWARYVLSLREEDNRR